MSDGADRTRAILGSASGLLGTALMFYGTRKWSRYSDAPKPKNELPLPGGKSAPASRTSSQDPKLSRRNSSTSRRSASALSFQPSRGTSRSRATTVEPSPVPADDAPEDVATASLVSTARAAVIVDPESEGDEVTSSPPLTSFSGILKKYEGPPSNPSNATTKSSSPPLQTSPAPVEATHTPLQVSSTPEEVCTPLQVSPSPVDVSTQVSPVPEEVVDEVVSYDGHDDFFWSAYRRVDAENRRVGALSMLVTSLVVDEESFQRHSIETDALRWYIDGEGYKVHSGMFLRKIEQLQKRRRTAEKESILQGKEAALASSERSLEDKRANLDTITSNMLREYHSSMERFQQMDLQRSEDEDRLIYATSDATSCSDGMRQFLCVWQQAAFDREEEASRTTIEQESLSTRLAIRSSFQSGLLSLDRLQYKLQYHAFLDDAKRHQEEKNREFEAVRAQILQSEQDKLHQLDLSIAAIKKEGGARQQSVLEALQSAADHETRFVSDATDLFSEWRTAIQEETSRGRQDREERAESARDDKSRHRQLEDRMSDALRIIASLQGELEVLQRQREADAAERLNPVVAPTPTTTVTTIPARVSLVAASTQSDDVQIDNSPSRGRRPTSPFSSTVTPTTTSTSNKRTQTGVEEEEVAEESLSFMMRIPTPITSELFNVFELQGPPLPEGWTLLTPSFYVGGSSIKCAGEAIISTNIEGVSVVVNAKELEFEDSLTVEAFADQRIQRMKDGAPDANIEVQSQGPAITVLERTDFEWFVSFTTGADTPSSRTNMALFAIFDNVGYYVTLSSPTNLYEEVVTIFTAFMSSVRIVANPRRASRGHRRATTIRYASKDNPSHTVDIPLRWRPLAGQNDFPMHFALGLNASPQENVAIRLDSETGKVRLSSWKELPMDIVRRVISSARVRDAPAPSPRMFVHHSVQFPLPPNNDCLITEHKIGFYEVSLLVALAPSTAAKTPFCNDLSDGAPKAIVRVAIIESPEVDLVKRLVMSISKRSPELVRNLEKHNTSQKKFVYAGPTKRPHVKINEATTTILFAVERAPGRWVLFHAEFPQHHVKVIAQYLIKAAAQCELFTPFVTDEAGDSMYESPSRSLSARELAARYSFRKVKSESTLSTL